VKIKIINVKQAKFDYFEKERLHKIRAIECQNIDDSGIIQNVIVFVSFKTKIQLDDKMAGFKGNKSAVLKMFK
jgi:DNA-directed RNA polymerase beta subunit